MGIDLAGTALATSSGLIATSGGNQIMKMGTTGILQRYNAAQALFRAGGSGTAASVDIGAANSWNPMIFNATNVNVLSCYNTANGRFTAPVTGIYLLTASTWVAGAGAGWHVFSMFWVNGDMALRRPSGGLHRIHAHGNTTGYAYDTETFEIISLVAGDYVNFYHYNGGFVNGWTPQYSRFEGYLLG